MVERGWVPGHAPRSDLARDCCVPNAFLVAGTPVALTQAYWLAREYEALIKDRQLLQAEMLHEYDEKVRGQR